MFLLFLNSRNDCMHIYTPFIDCMKTLSQVPAVSVGVLVMGDSLSGTVKGFELFF